VREIAGVTSGSAERPRIAVVLTQLGFGGAERQTVELLRRLVDDPWRPSLVVCLSEHLEPYGPVLCELGYRVEVLPRRSSFDAARLWRLRRLLERERTSLVYPVHLLASGYVALATGFGRRLPMLPTVRGARPVRGALRRVVYRRMIRRSPVTLVNSQRGKQVLVADLGVPAERIEVVPNGMDFAALEHEAKGPDPRPGLGIPEQAPLVLYVGKNAPVKDVPRLVRVLGLLLARHPEAHAAIAGHGLDAETGAALGPRLPAERTHWLGPRGDVPALLRGADALLLTSRSEGCPNVVLESLALGTPVVSGDVGDVRGMLGEALAELVVPPEKDEAYTDALERVLAEPAAYARRAAERRPELERRFGTPAMVEATVALWRRLA
jgi:glycosyltransferase involved in cell wall biosynthesis